MVRNSTTGGPSTRPLFDALLEEVMLAAREELGAEAYVHSRFETAASLFAEMSTSDDFSEFLTLPAYDMIVNASPGIGGG